MGGIGSGWHSRRGKAKTSDYHHVDIRRWQRDGLLTGSGFAWSWIRNGKRVASISAIVAVNEITLQYRIKRNEEWQDVNCKIRLSTSACNLGGSRPWFLCPCCHSRVAILYIGKFPACRKCYRLSYDSQCETEGDRQLRRVNTIRKKLGWPAGYMNGEGNKPKGMHWKTYHRLYKEQALQSVQAFNNLDAKMETLRKGMEKITKRMESRGKT